MSQKRAFNRHNLSRPSDTELNFSFQEDSDVSKNKENLESLQTSIDYPQRHKRITSVSNTQGDDNSLIINEQLEKVKQITTTDRIPNSQKQVSSLNRNTQLGKINKQQEFNNANSNQQGQKQSFQKKIIETNETEVVRKLLNFLNETSSVQYLELASYVDNLQISTLNQQKQELLSIKLKLYNALENVKIPLEFQNISNCIKKDIKLIDEVLYDYQQSGNSPQIWDKVVNIVKGIQENMLKIIHRVIYTGNNNNHHCSEKIQDLSTKRFQKKEITQQIKKNKNKILIEKEEDEDYFSDFSDENFEIEFEEEKIAEQVILILKEKLEQPSLMINIQDHVANIIYQQKAETNVIYEFKQTLNQILQIQFSDVEIESFLNILNFKNFCLEDIECVLEKIKQKDIEFWKKKIEKDRFDLIYQSFNFAKFNQQDNNRRSFTLNVIYDKIKMFNQKFSPSINQENEFQNGGQFSELYIKFYEQLNILANEKGYLNKSEFRRFMLYMEYPLSRKEIKVLFNVLDSQKHGKLFIQDINQILIDTPEFISQICNTLPNYCEDHYEEETQKQNIHCVIDKVKQYLNRKDPADFQNIFDVFLIKDRRKQGKLDYEKFSKCISECFLPLDQFEIDSLYSYFKGDYKSFLDEIGKYIIINNNNNLQEQQSNNENYQVQPQSCQNEFNELHQQQKEDILFQDPRLNTLTSCKYSNKNTIKLKMEHLEFECARLRKQNQEQTSQIQFYIQQNESLEEQVKKVNDCWDQNVKKLEEKHIEFIRKNYLYKEIDAIQTLSRFSKESDQEVHFIKKQHLKEVNDLKRIIEQKNQELDDYRIQLHGMLEELDYVKSGLTDRANLQSTFQQ